MYEMEGYTMQENNIAKITEKSYRIINNYANNNIVFQSLSGIFGFPITLLVDGTTVFTHYASLLDKIQELYGRKPIEREALVPIVKNISNEILFDIMVDIGVDSFSGYLF